MQRSRPQPEQVLGVAARMARLPPDDAAGLVAQRPAHELRSPRQLDELRGQRAATNLVAATAGVGEQRRHHGAVLRRCMAGPSGRDPEVRTRYAHAQHAPRGTESLEDAESAFAPPAPRCTHSSTPTEHGLLIQALASRHGALGDGLLGHGFLDGHRDLVGVRGCLRQLRPPALTCFSAVPNGSTAWVSTLATGGQASSSARQAAASGGHDQRDRGVLRRPSP